MSVQCYYKYNSELHHLRVGEYKKTEDDKQACIIEFVLLSILLEIARNLRKAELYLVLSFFILPLVELDHN